MLTETAEEAGFLLRVENLTIRIDQPHGGFLAVDDVSFELGEGETLALVGQSGSGKTMTALSLIGLLPRQARKVNGEVWFAHRRISSGGKASFKQLRGRDIAMIFQEPHCALNPVFRAGTQVVDVMKTHLRISSKSAKLKVLELFEHVGLSDPIWTYQAYAHQLSGGMAQRVMIAMALSCGPRLIIADEPTTALDVSTQLQILRLIKNLQEQHRFSLLLISHDISVVSALADSVIVMSGGKIVDRGDVRQILDHPDNSYTRSLVDANFPWAMN